MKESRSKYLFKIATILIGFVLLFYFLGFSSTILKSVTEIEFFGKVASVFYFANGLCFVGFMIVFFVFFINELVWLLSS